MRHASFKREPSPLYLPLKGGGRPPALQAKAGGWGSIAESGLTPTPTLPLSGGGSLAIVPFAK